MSGPSIPDQAASLVNAMQRAKERITEVRRAGGEWTAMQMLLEDAGDMAAESLRCAQKLANRIDGLADIEAARLKGKQ